LAFSVSFRRRRDTTLGIRIGRRRKVGRPKMKKKKSKLHFNSFLRPFTWEL